MDNGEHRCAPKEIKVKISTKGRYALRFMIDLAENGNDKYISLKDISIRQDVSLKYLEQIASALVKAGLVQSVRGSQGGYRLTRAPAEYTVGDILRPIEGEFACVACLESSPNLCERYETCQTVHFWEGLSKVITDYLDGTTLEDLMNQGSQSCGYYVI